MHTQFRANTGLRLYSLRGGHVLQEFVQMPILRSECCLKYKCSTSFLTSPCLCWFVYFLTVPEFILLFPTVTFHIYILYCGNGVQASEAVCWLLFSLSCCSLLQHSFAMPFHLLPSHCRAPFELFRSGLGYCSIPFKTSTKPCLFLQGWLIVGEEKVSQRMAHW